MSNAAEQPPRSLRQRASHLRELARLTRENAQYAEGRTYYREIEQADRMEAAAAELDRQATEPEPGA